MDSLVNHGGEHQYSNHTSTPSDDVTISVLPVSLSLVHIPRERLTEFTHPIIKLLVPPIPPTFLNVSFNETEISIIGEETTVAYFAAIARKETSPGWKNHTSRSPVEVSPSWVALQIDSHGQELGDASARIRDISALLSGISILYQSSKATDYIFVQSCLLPEVLSILSNANYISQSPHSSSESSSPGPSTRSNSPNPYAPLQQLHLRSGSDTLGLELDGFSRSRPRRSTNASQQSHASLHELLLAKANEVSRTPVVPLPKMPIGLMEQEEETRALANVKVLSSDLAVVGLSEQPDHVELWTMKVIKLLLFRSSLTPILSPSDEDSEESWHSAQEHEPLRDDEDDGPPLPFLSLTRASEGSSLTTDARLLVRAFPPGERHLLFASDELDSPSLYAPPAPFSLSPPPPSDEFLRCLHLDLSAFPLTRNGLVSWISEILVRKGDVRKFMYCSTFKTANLIVDAKDAARARKALRER